MKEKTLLYGAWAIALGASLASVYFIEISGNPAASLCWFERMLLFGLLLLLTVGILLKDEKVQYYAIPFIVLGGFSALYQQLAHWNIVTFAQQPCGANIVCTTKFFELFGFITQATLCLSAFIGIAACLWHCNRKKKT